tara:strand:+ start:476 stop:1120 length:645 start_codon:yes stop_codon:yes gene_type:complete
MGAVLAVGGVMAGLGALGGLMGSIGGQQNAEAQYLAGKIETERSNFQNALKNDKQNMAMARANAQRQWNNVKIGETALSNYTETLRNNRQAFQANSQNYARNMVQNHAAMKARATGKNLRGGMQDRLKALADSNFTKQRGAMRIQKFRADTSAENVYQNQLAKRDMLSKSEASIYMPGSSGVEPGSGTLNLIAGLLGGGASGFASGVSTGKALS